jgi:hypothetical protein
MSVLAEMQGVRIVKLVSCDGILIVVQPPGHMEACLPGSLRCAASAAEDISEGVAGTLDRE